MQPASRRSQNARVDPRRYSAACGSAQEFRCGGPAGARPTQSGSAAQAAAALLASRPAEGSDKLVAAVQAAVPDLATALKDADAEVRFQAAVALGEIGPPARAAVPELIQALEE